jgi:hypothetical protein
MGKKELLEARRAEGGMKISNEIQLFRRNENVNANILDLINHPSMKNMRGKLFPTNPSANK